MLESIAVMILLIVVVFAFVLEPVFRARKDRREFDEEDVVVIPDFRTYLADSDVAPSDDSGDDQGAEESSQTAAVPEARRIESQS
ncbi:MAG: hypothetical protein ACOC9Y_01435 [Chloroflexota bacterium]